MDAEIQGDQAVKSDLLKILNTEMKDFAAHNGVAIYKVYIALIDYLIGWTHKAAILVLITTALITLLAQAGFWRSARQISASLETLNSGSRRIGTGDFSPIEPASDIQAFDDLRTAMNDMSASLLHLRSSRDEMILQVSHKLRNRLMAIDGYAQEIAAGARSDSSGLGRSIQAESARLMDELDKLMAFTRVKDPDVLIPLEPLPLTEILQNSLDRFSAMGMKKGLSVRLTAGPSEIWVQGNEYLLEIILDNLLSNAVRHAEKEILLSIWSEDHLVRLQVMDDGSGIREEDLPHLFERFYRGTNGRFGLGLPIVLAAARKMDADLTAANRPEGGAVFTLTLKSSEGFSH
jgi:signal transduction histidine kinase